jgi:hypothetical protein
MHCAACSRKRNSISNKWVGASEAVSKLRIAGNETHSAPKARKTIARGEHSEPLVRGANRRSPGGAKDIDIA